MINFLLWTLLFDYFPLYSQISILTHPQILMLHMGSTMGEFLRTLRWIVLLFYLFCAEIWRIKCLENRCYCEEELWLIDCSRAKLKAIPKSVPLVNYTTLNLRHNLLVQANFSVLEEQLPNLKNGGPEGQLVRLQRIPRKNDFRSNHWLWNYQGGVCENHYNDKGGQNNSQGELAPTNNDYKYFITTRSRPCYFHNFLYACFDLNICTNAGPHRLFKLKHTRTLPTSHVLSLFNADSEEHVVFDVTAL